MCESIRGKSSTDQKIEDWDRVFPSAVKKNRSVQCGQYACMFFFLHRHVGGKISCFMLYLMHLCGCAATAWVAKLRSMWGEVTTGARRAQ